MSIDKENHRLNENQFEYLSASLNMAPSGAGTPCNLFMPSVFSQMRLRMRAEKDYGSISNLLCQELGWSESHLHQALSPEQQDAVALIILSYKDGNGFLLGDMAGFGKGRIVATTAYFMKRCGHFPIISTLIPDLFSNLAIDFRDIGVLDEMGVPFVVNSGIAIEDIRLSDTPLMFPKIKPKAHKEYINGDVKEISKKFGFVLTTYSQFTKEDSDKTKFITALVEAESVALINDEAHSIARFLAASSKIYYRLGRSSVFRMESTATAGRNAMDLRSYSKTYPWLSTLPFSCYEAMTERGLNELATLSTIRALAIGTMLRRENDRTGIDFSYVMPDAETGRLIGVLDDYGVRLFQAMKRLSVMNWRATQELNNQRKSGSDPLWTGPDFFSLAGRLSRQLTACMIARAVGQIAVAELEKGRKPFIAMDVTLESLLENEERDEDIKPEDVDFSILAKEAVQILLKIEANKKPPVKIDDVDIFGERFSSSVKKILDEINLVIDNMPEIIPSPLDTVRDIVSASVKESGSGKWTITEISGRNQQRIDGVFQPIRESRNSRTAKFNNGDYDAVVCTRAMSTGQSFHAAPFFRDQSQRVFIEGVPPDNPLQRTQMHGRVQRKGEVCKPLYLGVKTGLTYHEGRLRHLSRKDQRMNISVRGEKGDHVFASQIEMFSVQTVLARHPRIKGLMGLNTRFSEEDGGIVDALYRRSFMIEQKDRDLIFGEVEREIQKRQDRLEEVMTVWNDKDGGSGWEVMKESVIEGRPEDGTSVSLICLERDVVCQTAPLIEGWDISVCNEAVAALKNRESRHAWLEAYRPRWAQSIDHALKLYRNSSVPFAVSQNLVGKWNERCDMIVSFISGLKTGDGLFAPNQYGVVGSALFSHITPPRGNFFKWDEWLIYYSVPGHDRLLFVTMEQVFSDTFFKNPFVRIGRNDVPYIRQDFDRAKNGRERIFILGGRNPAGMVSWVDDLGEYCWNALNYRRKGDHNERYAVFVSPIAVYEMKRLQRRLFTTEEVISAVMNGVPVIVSKEANVCTIFHQNGCFRINMHIQGKGRKIWKETAALIADAYGFDKKSTSFIIRKEPEKAVDILRSNFEMFVSSSDYMRLH